MALSADIFGAVCLSLAPRFLVPVKGWSWPVTEYFAELPPQRVCGVVLWRLRLALADVLLCKHLSREVLWITHPFQLIAFQR